MIIGLVHVIIVTVTVMFIVYLIVCIVRSLRVTVTINEVLSYLISCADAVRLLKRKPFDYTDVSAIFLLVATSRDIAVSEDILLFSGAQPVTSGFVCLFVFHIDQQYIRVYGS